MRELIGLVRSAAFGRLSLGLAVAVLAAACRSDDEQAEEGFSNEAETTQLECERLNYPCTWAEVAPAVLARTDELADRAVEMFEAGSSAMDVAAMLEGQEDIAALDYDHESVLFRLVGGGSVGVLGPDGLHPGFLSFGRAPPRGVQASDDASDAVGDQRSSDEKPGKKALILEPYLWEGGADESLRVHTALMAVVTKRLEATRDFEVCDGGNCVRRFANDWAESQGDDGRSEQCDPWSNPDCPVNYEVTIDHFKNWDKYDVIHVTTHGTVLRSLADKDKKLGKAAGIATGTLISGDLLDAFGGDAQDWTEGEEYEGARQNLRAFGVELEHGVRLWRASETKWCRDPNRAFPQSSRAFAQFCKPSGLWRVYLTIDFFRKNYPQGLKDKLVFLSSCYSLDPQFPDLAKHLTKDGSSAVLGWTDVVAFDAASKALATFYKYWIGEDLVRGGSTARAAYDEVKKEFAALPWGFAGASGLTLGPGDDDGPSRGRADLIREGSTGKRGREIVFLLDPETDEDLEDGGWVQTIGAPGDSEDDELRVDFEVIGVDEEDDIDDYVLHLRVGDRELKESWRLDEQVDVGVWQMEDTVDLGFDTSDGQVEDIEVWTELPGGGISRWLYEDMHLGGPYWRMSFTGGEESGRYSGNAVEFRLAEDRWDGNSLSMRSQKSADPDVTIVAMMPPDFSLAPGTYPLCFSEHDYCAEVLFNPVTGDPLAQDWAGYVTGDGVTVDYPYDGNDMGPAFRYPPPATLTITRVADDIIEGRIEGQLFKEVYTPKPVGHSRHFVTASTTIEFAAKRLKGP